MKENRSTIPNFLIIGYGYMGHRYGTVLERMHAPYRYLDLTEKSFDQTIRFTKRISVQMKSGNNNINL
jgi:hypothetical protein